MVLKLLATKGLGLLGKSGRNTKKFDPAGDIKKEKIKKEYKKAAGVGAAGAVGISAAVKNIKNTLESEYGKKK